MQLRVSFSTASILPEDSSEIALYFSAVMSAKGKGICCVKGKNYDYYDSEIKKQVFEL